MPPSISISTYTFSCLTYRWRGNRILFKQWKSPRKFFMLHPIHRTGTSLQLFLHNGNQNSSPPLHRSSTLRSSVGRPRPCNSSLHSAKLPLHRHRILGPGPPLRHLELLPSQRRLLGRQLPHYQCWEIFRAFPLHRRRRQSA